MSRDDIFMAAVRLLEEMGASDMDSRDEARGIAKLLFCLSAAEPTINSNKQEAPPPAVREMCQECYRYLD